MHNLHAGGPPPSSRGAALRCLSWNVHKCRGGDGVRDPERILRTIARIGPDIAVLQEADLKFGKNRALIEPEQAMKLAGMRVCIPELPRSGCIGWRGNALLAKDWICLVSSESIALPSLEPRGAVIWKLSASGKVFEVIGLHLGLLSVFRLLQATRVAKAIASRENVPAIVAGDTNDWRSGSMDMHPIELVLGAAAARHRTFPAKRPMLALDRIAAGKGAVIEAAWTDCCASRASDHVPVVSEIKLPGDG